MAKTYPRQVRVYLSEEEFQNLEAYCKQRDWSRSKGSRELFSKALNAEQRGRGSRALPGELNRRMEPVTEAAQEAAANIREGLNPTPARKAEFGQHTTYGESFVVTKEMRQSILEDEDCGLNIVKQSEKNVEGQMPPGHEKSYMDAPSPYGPGFDHWSAANRHHGARLGEAI